jgi:hypothetical protein
VNEGTAERRALSYLEASVSGKLNNLLWLAEYRSKSISQSFEDLLAREINIPEGVRSLAATSQQHLREFLEKECIRDPNFPAVLKKGDSDFLGGSFARHTKAKPLDDIDIYLPLDGAALFYMMNDGIIRLPYTVVADKPALSNPVLGPRFTVGRFVSSSKVIDEFAAVLKRRFPQTRVKANGQAITLRMTHGESQNQDGLGYDVVPCFSLVPHRQDEREFYLMPDGRGGWMRTNPKADARVADVLQENHNKLFRKIVKLVKYWNAEHLSSNLNSYFIELSIAKVFWDKAVKSEPVMTLSYGVALALWAVQQAATQGAQQSWVVNAPAVEPGTLLAGQRIMLKSCTDSACSAWEDEKGGRSASAAAKWKRVFGDGFPD